MSEKIYSVCSLGKDRWFWAVWESYDQAADNFTQARHGYTSTKDEAFAAAMREVGQASFIGGRQRWAKNLYREFVKQRRKPNTKANGATQVEYVHELFWYDGDPHWHRHRIVKKTKARIYVSVVPEHQTWNNDDRTFVLDRAELETTGEADNKGQGWFLHYYTDEGKMRYEAERTRGRSVPEYLTILGLDTHATLKDIKRAYRRLAHELHPDKGGDQAKFIELTEAYEQAIKAEQQ